MPKIAQSQGGQVTSQVIAQPRAQNLPASAFESPIAQGAVDLAKAGAQMVQRIDTTSAEEALVKFEREKNELFFNPDTGYFNTQGRDAYDSSISTSEELEKLKTKYGDTLGQNARSMFDKAAAAHITRGNVDIRRHASKGLKAWEVATLESQVENSIENASLYFSDPDQLKIQGALGRQAVIDASEMAGIGAEATNERLQTFNSAFARSAIEAATVESAKAGEEMLDKLGDQLEGPDKAKMESQIAKKEKLEKTQSDANLAVLTATRLTDQYSGQPGARSDIIDEVNKIEDAELRKKTMSEAMGQLSRIRKAEIELEKDYYHSAIEMVNNGLTSTEIEAQNPEAWLGMSNIQRNNILSGKYMVTDQALLARLRSLPVKEKSEINPADYAADLRPSDLQKLITEVNAAKKGNPSSRVQSLSSKSMIAAENAFGPKSKWKNEPARGTAANEFLTELQDSLDEFQADKGSRATPAEENAIIAEFTSSVAQKRSFLGVDFLASDVELNLSNTPPRDMQLLNRMIDNTSNINKDDLVAAYQLLIDNEIPVNSTTLKNAYNQGRK